MNKLRTKYKGKVFRYVLSVMDVFSRYHWLVPLQRKRSSHVARELIRIYREQGAPLVIQHDQGTEFDGAVSRLCKQLQIKANKGRPYHPQSQGKVERAHRTFKKKLRYDFLSMKKAGVNWPKGLPHYTQALNQDPKEELAWKAPFEIYFGRKPSVATEAHSSCAKERDVQAEKYEDMVRPRPRDYKSHSKRVKAKRTQALSASEKCANRMVQREAKKRPPSVYQVGETVLIRYPGTGSKLVKKRYVLEAQVLKKNLEKDLYKVAFSSPIAGKNTKKGMSVYDVTSMTMDKENRKKKKAKETSPKSAKAAHRKHYKLSYDSERVFMEDRLNSAHFLISYDPPGDGNCQFSVVCEALRNIGLYRSVKTLREEIVEYLKDHPHMQNLTTDAWSTYLQNMAKNGTFGDHLTLQAAADHFNVEFNVISSLGPAATTVISPQNSVPISSFYIGHFAEGDGEHYVT